MDILDTVRNGLETTAITSVIGSKRSYNMDKSTIQLDKTVIKTLASLGKKGESYQDIILKL